MKTQTNRFFTRFPYPEAENYALRCPWPPDLLYAFPPLPLIPRVLWKLLTEKADVLLVALHWPRRPWFVDLVSLSVARPWRIPGDRISFA